MKLNGFIYVMKSIQKCISVILKYSSRNYNLYLLLKTQSNLILVLKYLRNNSICYVKTLSDITVIDYPNQSFRFHVSYNLMSFLYNVRFFITYFLKEGDLLPSIYELYKSAV